MSKPTFTMEELSKDKISEFISEDKSFTIRQVNPLQFPSLIRSIEAIMETQGKKYVTYSEGRAPLAHSGLSPDNPLASLAAQSGIGEDQPGRTADYEISKSYFLSTIHVKHGNNGARS